MLYSKTLCCRTLPGDFAQGAGVSSLSLAGNNLVRPTRVCQIGVCPCVHHGPQEGGLLPKRHTMLWMHISSSLSAACSAQKGAGIHAQSMQAWREFVPKARVKLQQRIRKSVSQRISSCRPGKPAAASYIP